VAHCFVFKIAILIFLYGVFRPEPWLGRQRRGVTLAVPTDVRKRSVPSANARVFGCAVGTQIVCVCVFVCYVAIRKETSQWDTVLLPASVTALLCLLTKTAPSYRNTPCVKYRPSVRRINAYFMCFLSNSPSCSAIQTHWPIHVSTTSVYCSLQATCFDLLTGHRQCLQQK